MDHHEQNGSEKPTDQQEDEEPENCAQENAIAEARKSDEEEEEVQEASEEHVPISTANEETGEVEETQSNGDETGDLYSAKASAPAPAPSPLPLAPANKSPRTQPERCPSNPSVAPRRCTLQPASAPTFSEPLVDDGFDSPGHSDAPSTSAASILDARANSNGNAGSTELTSDGDYAVDADGRSSVHVLKTWRGNKRQQLVPRVNELLPCEPSAMPNTAASGRNTPSSSGRQTPISSAAAASSSVRSFDSSSSNGRQKNGAHVASNAESRGSAGAYIARTSQPTKLERSSSRTPYESDMSAEEQPAVQNLAIRSHSLPSAERPAIGAAGDASPEDCSFLDNADAAELELEPTIGLFTVQQTSLNVAGASAVNSAAPACALARQSHGSCGLNAQRGGWRGGFGELRENVTNASHFDSHACGDARCNAPHNRQNEEFDCNYFGNHSALNGVRAPGSRCGPNNRYEGQSAPSRRPQVLPTAPFGTKVEHEHRDLAAGAYRGASNQMGPRFRHNGSHVGPVAGAGPRQPTGGYYTASGESASPVIDPQMDSWYPSLKQQQSTGPEPEPAYERLEPNHLKQMCGASTPGLTVKLNARGGRRTVLAHNAHVHSQHSGGVQGCAGGAGAYCHKTGEGGSWSSGQPAEEESEVIPREELDRYRAEAARMKAERERLREQLRHKFEQLVSNKSPNA